MPSPTPTELDRYLKILRMTGATGTTEEEKDAFRRKLQAMEREYPGIRELATDVEAVIAVGGLKALQGAQSRFPTGPGWGALKETAARAGLGALEKMADEIAGQVSGADRHTHLAPKECVIKAHSCPPDQVCLEIRMRRQDALRDRTLNRILDALATEIQTTAEG